MDELSRIRHSCAHVLATAVLRLWPEAKLDIGPPTEEGFYYDFDLEHRFSPEDFEKIEAEMKKVVKLLKTHLRKKVVKKKLQLTHLPMKVVWKLKMRLPMKEKIQLR